MPIDWAGGYSSSWRVMLVDPETWEDSEELPGVVSVRIERDAAKRRLESAEVVADAAQDGAFREGYYRIEMLASQDGEVERHAIATMLMQSGTSGRGRGRSELSVSGSSVLQAAHDERMPVGTYAPRGCDGAAWAATLLSSCIPAPVVAEGSFELSGHVVFGAGTSCLDAAWDVLEAAGWCIRIDGDGTVRLGPRPSEPVLVLDAAGARMLAPEIMRDADYSGVPNRYTAVEGAAVATAANEDEASPTSFQARGRWVDVVDTSPKRVDGETLGGYARRRLSEESTVRRACSYTREFWPGVHPFDVVRGSLPSAGLEGDMRVESQSLECGRGVTVAEVAAIEEVTYA